MQSFLYMQKSTDFIQQSGFQREGNWNLGTQRLPKLYGVSIELKKVLIFFFIFLILQSQEPRHIL